MSSSLTFWEDIPEFGGWRNIFWVLRVLKGVRTLDFWSCFCLQPNLPQSAEYIRVNLNVGYKFQEMWRYKPERRHDLNRGLGMWTVMLTLCHLCVCVCVCVCGFFVVVVFVFNSGHEIRLLFCWPPWGSTKHRKKWNILTSVFLGNNTEGQSPSLLKVIWG